MKVNACWDLWLLRTMLSTFYVFQRPEKMYRVHLTYIHPAEDGEVLEKYGYSDYFLLELIRKQIHYLCNGKFIAFFFIMPFSEEAGLILDILASLFSLVISKLDTQESFLTLSTLACFSSIYNLCQDLRGSSIIPLFSSIVHQALLQKLER